MVAEHICHLCFAAGAVEGRDKVPDARGHDQQVARRPRGWVPVGVRRSSRRQSGAAGAHLVLALTEPESQPALQHVPRLVVLMVDVERRDVAGRVVTAAGVPPLHQHQTGRADLGPGQRLHRRAVHRSQP